MDFNRILTIITHIIYEFEVYEKFMEISYRLFESMSDAEGIVNVQRQAWKMDDLGIVPTFETKAVADVGFVYVAESNSEIIGFIYGYHHFPDIHYSHMMAVLPEYQGNSVGYYLKKFHREQILKSNHWVNSVQWTVDPLLPNNAFLNFAKLGGYCDTYKVNYYGDPGSDGVEIYAGVPTDRFKLVWPIRTDRVARRMENYRSDRKSYAELENKGNVVNDIVDNKFNQLNPIPEHDDYFFVEVPFDYQEIRRHSIDLAIDWRKKFQNICVSSMNNDYIVTDYHHFKKENGAMNFYQFQKIHTFDIF